MSITTVIKSIQGIMRQDAGVDGDAQRLSQLVWLLFLKIIDDKEKEYELTNEKYKFPIPAPYRWRNWAADDEGMTGDELLEFINNDLFKKLKELKVAENGSGKMAHVIRTIFDGTYNYMKSGTLIRQVINKINEVDFNSADDRHLFNDIYEKLLKDLQSAGNAGEFYTPRAVTQFIVEMVDPKLGEKILDPACGTGGFLVNSIEHIRENYVKTGSDEKKLQNSIFGIEKKPLPHMLCSTNMILHGVEVPYKIKRDNLLASPLKNYTSKDRVEVIVTNPPFGGTEEEGVPSNFPKAYRTKETADLFLVLIMHLLKQGGRCGMVLPDGSLFGEGVKTKIKEKLLEECNLHTIIRLPGGVFGPYTDISTNLLFFVKGVPTKEVWYYEHKYPEGLKTYNKSNPMTIDEFNQEKEWWDNRVENDHAWKVSIEEIKNRNCNLDIKNSNKKMEAKVLSTVDIIKKLKNSINESSQIIDDIEKEVK